MTAADRVPLAREQRRAGAVFVPVVIEAADVAWLVALGLLADAETGDRKAVAAAILAAIRRPDEPPQAAPVVSAPAPTVRAVDPIAAIFWAAAARAYTP